MSRVLLVDDDRSLVDALAINFEDEGFEVDIAHDGAEALVRIKNDRPDVVICDVNMPKVDGFSVCRRLRESGDELPFILLTSRDNEIDEALGLELGADDYVAKPFSTRVLVARVRALLRRQAALSGEDATTEEEEEPVVESGDVRLDTARLQVQYHGEEIETTVTEFRLLEAFVRRPGLVLSRDRLMELARGDDSVVADRIIDTYVRRLRSKFGDVSDDFDCIETVIGAGYRWRCGD